MISSLWLRQIPHCKFNNVIVKFFFCIWNEKRQMSIVWIFKWGWRSKEKNLQSPTDLSLKQIQIIFALRSSKYNSKVNPHWSTMSLADQTECWTSELNKYLWPWFLTPQCDIAHLSIKYTSQINLLSMSSNEFKFLNSFFFSQVHELSVDMCEFFCH